MPKTCRTRNMTHMAIRLHRTHRPFIQYILDMEGKPKQQVSGEGYDTERRDMNVYELDARSSRPNGIFESQYPIPIFSPLDDPVPCQDGNGKWAQDPSKFAEIWIDCAHKYDLTDPEVADDCMPYDGPHLYPVGVAMELLKNKIIEQSDCIWGGLFCTFYQSICLESFSDQTSKLCH